MQEVLAIIGKRPIKGFSKTRLAKDLGEDKALVLYRAFIDDFFKLIPKKYKIYFFGTPNDAATKKYFQEITELNFFFQKELPFFARLKDIFKTIERLEGAECFVHLTGTDIPDFPFAELESVGEDADVYVGPDRDGGYYYIGAKSGRQDIFDISVADGSRSVFTKTMQLCEEKGDRVRLLKEWSDIDTKADLENSSLYEKYEKIIKK